MLIEVILAVVGVVALIFASIFDLKTREVPDWISYGLVVIALGIRLIYSFLTKDYTFFAYGLIGGLVMFLIGMGMYYGRQWGGGDAKLVIGLGALFFKSGLHDYFIVNLLINILIVGGLYGLGWAIYLGIKNKKKFMPNFKRLFVKTTKIRILFLGLALIIGFSLFFIETFTLKFLVFVLAFMILIYPYIYIVIKAVEDSCMYKKVKVNKLTEGDWLAENIYKNKKLVLKVNKGLSLKNIELLKKSRIKEVLIKEGIPFVPSFLIALLISFFIGLI